MDVVYTDEAEAENTKSMLAEKTESVPWVFPKLPIGILIVVIPCATNGFGNTVSLGGGNRTFTSEVSITFTQLSRSGTSNFTYMREAVGT